MMYTFVYMLIAIVGWLFTVHKFVYKFHPFLINSGPPTKTSMLKFGEAYGESVCFWSNLFEMFLLTKSQLVNEMRLQFESAVKNRFFQCHNGKTMVESSAFRGFCHGRSR